MTVQPQTFQIIPFTVEAMRWQSEDADNAQAVLDWLESLKVGPQLSDDGQSIILLATGTLVKSGSWVFRMPSGLVATGPDDWFRRSYEPPVGDDAHSREHQAAVAIGRVIAELPASVREQIDIDSLELASAAAAAGVYEPVIAGMRADGLPAALADDLRMVLDQKVPHVHLRPGRWDDDDTVCTVCKARARLQMLVDATMEREATDAG